MKQPSEDLKKELKKGLETLQTLRDEVRVKLHLAGMEAKEQWKEIEPELDRVEQAASEFTEASRSAIQQALGRLSQFREKLH